MFVEGEQSKLGLLRLVVGPLDVNCYVLWNKATKEAVIIDPGGDGDMIAKEVNDRSLKPVRIINTHGHFDHIGSNAELVRLFGVGLAIHSDDVELLERAPMMASQYGLPAPEVEKPELLLEDKATLSIGDISIEVLHTPGHSRGGVCFYIPSAGVIITGDTLFAASIGRTDLPGGDFDTLIASIKNKIMPLPDSVRIFPGHGGESSVGDEKLINSFLQG
ncbi:MAG: MBL fold metallo-hydrolase [Deltaproteobacteria bacterium]|nr:MBL fold metallo-hydrolase [Deltaproteobacteria bacterium]